MSAQVAVAPPVPAQKTRTSKASAAPVAAPSVVDPLHAGALKDPLTEPAPGAPVLAPVAAPVGVAVAPVAKGAAKDGVAGS